MKGAGEVIIVPMNCANKLVEKYNSSNVRHYNITDFDIGKGKTPVTENNDEIIMNKIKEK